MRITISVSDEIYKCIERIRANYIGTYGMNISKTRIVKAIFERAMKNMSDEDILKLLSGGD